MTFHLFYFYLHQNFYIDSIKKVVGVVFYIYIFEVISHFNLDCQYKNSFNL